MHLLPIYFTTTRHKSKQKKRAALQRIDHAAFVYKMTGGKKADREVLKKDWLNEYKSTMQVDRDDYVSFGMTDGSTARPEPKVYTGGNLKGIATMHKSNMVPVFNSQDAEDISKMRRG